MVEHTRYVELGTQDGGSLWVEVDRRARTPQPGGVIDAGARERLQHAVDSTVAMVAHSLGATIAKIAHEVADTLGDLDDAPAEAEIVFGVKVAAEIGNVAVAKSSGEGHYSVRLLWKQTAASRSQPD